MYIWGSNPIPEALRLRSRHEGKMKSGKWISLALLACGLVLLTSGCSCLQLAHAPYPNVEYELANKPSQDEARGAAD